MTALRMDNVSIVVEDLEKAIAFFAEIGLELQGRTTVEGPWVDQCIGLRGARCDIAMMGMPDGHGRIELSQFQRPAAVAPAAPAQANTLGMMRVMFLVDDLDDTVARLEKHGAVLFDRVAQYEQIYRLCYLRGPSGCVVALAEEVG